MNVEYTLFFWLFFITWFVVRFVYRNAVLPTVHDWARFKLFSLRDDLRRIELESGLGDETDFSYRFMEKSFNDSIRCLDKVSLATIIFHKPNARVREEVRSNLRRFDHEAPLSLKKLDVFYVRVMLYTMLANSPFLLVMGLIWSLFVRLFKSGDPIRSFKKQKRDAFHCYNV